MRNAIFYIRHIGDPLDLIVDLGTLGQGCDLNSSKTFEFKYREPLIPAPVSCPATEMIFTDFIRH